MTEGSRRPRRRGRRRTRRTDRRGAARTKQFKDARLTGIFSATVTPLINQDGEPVGRVLVARDITRQTRLEAEREALRERLTQSEKLASLGQFVAGIAHEMNNPLQGVLGHLELLIDTSEAAKPVRPTLRRIYQEGDRAAKIVRNLLVFTGARRMVRHAAPDRARPVARAYEPARRAQTQRDPDRAASGGRCAAHWRRRATPAAGVSEHPHQRGACDRGRTGQPGRIDVYIAPSADARFVVLTIRDTGPGIPADVLPRIFDPFFTTKDVGQGTGLGLAITYGIIQEHGGTIQAANGPTAGRDSRWHSRSQASGDRSNRVP